MKKKSWPNLRDISIWMVLILFGLMTPAPAAELKHLSLDEANSLGITISTDSMIKVEGKSAIKISTLSPTTICLGEISGLGVENAKLIYQAKVRCEKLEGTAFLEMWCHIGGGQYFSRGMNSTVTGSMEWTTLQTPFFLQQGQKAEKVTLNIVINGKGTVWVDDLFLLKEPLK